MNLWRTFMNAMARKAGYVVIAAAVALLAAWWKA